MERWFVSRYYRRLGFLVECMVALFGILLPMLALVVEMGGHPCRNAFLDPIPTAFNLIQIALLPIVMMGVLLGARGAWTEFAVGWVLAVCGHFTLLFLPVLPQAVAMLVFLGLGLLPLSPLLALITVLLVVLRLGPSGSIAMGALACVLVQSLSILRTDLTRQWVTNGNVACLRRWGSTEVLLADSHSHEHNPEKSAEMYWRVTGQDPSRNDPSLPLKLSASRLDASIDADAALAYLEWTATVHNPASADAEGEMLLALPPDTFASRVTLWINGTEREAAFASTGQAQAAYDSVVNQRMDPILVTSAGAGRLKIHCFPVPARGDMKFRIGLSSRMTIRKPDQAILEMPRLLSDNFRERVQTSYWLESTRALNEGGKVLRTEDGSPVTVWRDPKCRAVRCRLKQGGWLSSRLVTKKPTKLAVVIDGSQSMAAHEVMIRAALLTLPAALPVLAGDGGPREVRGNELEFVGGQDNVPALEYALKRADTVVWLHGPQPVLPTGPDRLKQLLERGPGRILEYPLSPGEDPLLPQLDLPNLQTLSASSEPLESLKALAQPFYVWQYQTTSGQPAGRQTSGHLARIWAAQSGSLQQAIRYQLVTPRTGAVVLETAQQYQQNLLQPVDPGSVPTIPEPGTIVLLGVGAASFLKRRRR